MPSTKHEAPLVLVRENPDLVRHFCAQVGVSVPPDCRPELASEDATQVRPLAKDKTIIFKNEGIAKLAVVFEVQLRFEKGKHRSWPMYLASARYFHECPAVLLVVCPDAAEVTACAAPIDLGHPGLTLYPLVVDPESIKKITNLEEAVADLELAVMSGFMHGNGEDGEVILELVVAALATADRDRQGQYTDLLLSNLGEPRKSFLKELLMSAQYEYTSELFLDVKAKGIAEGKAEGQAEGEARTLLLLLDRRGIVVDAESEERIRSCLDTDQLDCWVGRALDITHIEDLFDE